MGFKYIFKAWVGAFKNVNSCTLIKENGGVFGIKRWLSSLFRWTLTLMLGRQTPIATQVFQKSMALGFCLAILKNKIHTAWGLSLETHSPQTHGLNLKRKKEGRAPYSRRGARNQATCRYKSGDFWKDVC